MAKDNVQHLFTMDEEHFVAFLGQLQSLEPSPGDLIHALNLQLDRADVGRAQLRKGGLLVAASLIPFALSFVFNESTISQAVWTILFATVAAVGGGQIYQGMGRRSRENKLRQLAIEGRRTLEGQDGFLWRFEPFLQDWDHDLAPTVRNTLAIVCESSKADNWQDDLEHLRTYWYWAAACERRMNVVKAEMRW